MPVKPQHKTSRAILALLFFSGLLLPVSLAAGCEQVEQPQDLPIASDAARPAVVAAGAGPEQPEKIAVGAPIAPSLAGAFYSADPGELRRLVNGYLDAAEDKKLANIWALLAPHAGYRFSGPVAGTAFRQVRGRTITRVVLIGFAHSPYTPARRLRPLGLGTTLAPAFQTPLGPLEVDVAETRALIETYDFISDAPGVFFGEHSHEVELPFIQVALPKARLVPINFGVVQDYLLSEKLGSVLYDRYMNDPHTLVVASSDMSHFHPYKEAVRLDRHSLDLVGALDGARLIEQAADPSLGFCGLNPLLALIHAQSRAGGPKPRVLEYKNSGDTMGDKRKVVGYGAIAFLRPVKADLGEHKPATHRNKGVDMDYALNDQQKQQLIEIARESVRQWVKNRTRPEFDISDPLLLEKGAAFVTLKKKGQLRGCIGHTEPHLPLFECVREMAIAAAASDPRFSPVSVSELDALSHEVTVLTPMRKVENLEDIVVGRDGLMMQKGMARGLLLPQVPEEWGWDREQFLSHTAQKAGLPMDAWRDGSVTVYSFQGIVFGDDDASD